MSIQDRFAQTDRDVEDTATWLQEVGLAGPAYLVLYGMRPLSFVGGQSLLFLQPLLPVGKWRLAAGRFAELLGDRSRLDALLESLEARLRGKGNAHDKEKA